MNYLKIYNQLIHKRKVIEPLIKKGDGTIETQHIIPTSCGGLNVEWNKVNLTLREHFIAHWLLTKIYKNTRFEGKMYKAFQMMCNTKLDSKTLKNNKVKVTSYVYKQARINANLSISGENSPFKRLDIRLKLSKARIGKKLAKSSKEKMSKSQKRLKLIHEISSRIIKRIPKDQKIPIGWLAGSGKSSTKGKRWIHNIKTSKNKLILKSLPLPKDFSEGKILSEKEYKSNSFVRYSKSKLTS